MSEFTYRKKLVVFRGAPVKKNTLYKKTPFLEIIETPDSGCPEEDKRRKNQVEGGVEEYERGDDSDSDSDVTLTSRCGKVRYN